MKIKKRTFFDTIKRFSEPFINNSRQTYEVLFKGALSGINPFMHVMFIAYVIDTIENGNQELFFIAFWSYIVYMIVYEIISIVTYRWGWYTGVPTYMNYISSKYITKYIHLNNNYTERVGTGKTISIVERGVESWARNIDLILYYGIGILISFLFVFFTILKLSLLAAFIFIFLYLFICYLSLFFNDKMTHYRDKRIDQVNLYSKGLVKIIMSKLEILQASKINGELTRIAAYNNKAKEYNLKMAPYFHSILHVPQIILFVVKAVFLYYISILIFRETFQISNFFSIFGVLLLLESNILKSVMFFKNFTKEFASVEKLWQFFDIAPKMQGYNKGKKFKHKTGAIELKNLSYAYNKDNNIFTDFSLKIPGEQVTAIVGVSGGGKSTLVKLISGYIRADEGEIIIDGQKLSEVSLKSYYKDIGYLTQEPSVFDGTVMENLCYALTKKPSKKKLDEVIKMSKCEFVYDFPAGLKTEIGEKGIRLSGGQRQRLAIAKIFLKNPKIIILDEPTSALDSFSEEQITMAMHNLFKGRTVIIIAHRLQTVKSANDIILIEDGKVKERGTHASLVRKKGIYKKMLDLQSGF